MSKIKNKYIAEIDRNCPDNEKWIIDNLIYATIIGSQAYGINQDDSDVDVYGITVPSRDVIFPSLSGYIPGFSKDIPHFNVKQIHHMKLGNSQLDSQIYNIVNFFRLAANNNPNILEILYVPDNCIIHMNSTGRLIRDNRHLFLSKRVKHSMMGYAYAQMKNIKTKKPKPGSRRWELVQKYGFDTKYASHLVRLILEAEMALTEGTLDLQRHKEMLKSIRRGEMTIDEIERFVKRKEELLDIIYATNDTLQYNVDEKKLLDLLHECLKVELGI